MTRDEQIAQLKPGDRVVLRGVSAPRTLIAVAGDVVVYALAHGGASAQVRHVDDLILPEPPPKPKAVPGVRYRSGGYVRMGTRDGRLWNPELHLPTVDLDSTWIPIDPVEEGK